jgi:hypothetical protein
MFISNATGQKPGFWRAFGHSYLENQLGTADQTGRPDGIFRDIMSILCNEWQNWAVTGSCLMKQGVSQGGYARAFQAMPGAIRGAPYVSNGGASVLCWGINDIGKSGPGPTYMSAFIDAMRTVISRCRMASIKENTDASIAYGAGFTLASSSFEWTSGTSYRTATTTTGANFTITLPADYDGSTVVICFNGFVNGGVGTFSGTAGVTGTLSTSQLIPVSEVSHTPRIRRITNLTSANAGQTIVFTVNSLDASGSVDFDCWWIESANPPPVIVMDIVRMNATGYAGFPQISANSVAVNDAFVQTWNDALYRLVEEFDDMVQVAYCDAAINKKASWLWSVDGVHPNEFGSAQLADAMADAASRLAVPTSVPVGAAGLTLAAFMNSPSPRGGQMLRNHRAGTWYTAEYGDIGTAYVPVSGDMFCLPFQVTNPRRRIQQFAMAVAGTITGTCTIRWGLYDDPEQSGYPFSLMHELTSGGAFTVTTAIGVKTSPATPGAGSIDKPLDPGVFWLVMKVTAIGSPAGTFTTLRGMSLLMPNVTTTGLPLTTNLGYMGYKHTGQGTGALPSSYPASGVLTSDIPYIGFRFQ